MHHNKKTRRVIAVVAVALAAVLSALLAVNDATDGYLLGLITPMSMTSVIKEPHFAATVLQVQDNAILVRVHEGEDARRSSDLISVSLNVRLKGSATHFSVGDTVTVYYNGEIAESYPAQVHTVYAIVPTSPDMGAGTDDLYAPSSMGTPLTLQDVRVLAKKGDSLLLEDFRKYAGVNVSSSLDAYIMVYGVENGYRLIVRADQNGRPDSAELENIWESGGSGIDIRYEDIDAFLSKWPVVMQVKDGTATPAGATVTLKNVTKAEYIYGEDFAIQRKTPDGWADVEPVIESYGFNSIGYTLPPMESREVTVDWAWLYGRLPAGDYRIVKDALYVRAPGDYDTFTLYGVFVIAE